ncbi:MAG: DPP IV N-terminal domain-containing protein [Pseudomonadota bacterium]
MTTEPRPATLTPEALFLGDALIDSLPERPTLVPHRRQLLFLAGSSDQTGERALWLRDLDTDAPPSTAWLTISELLPLLAGATHEESAAERAERERRRRFGAGITQFMLRPQVQADDSRAPAPEIVVVAEGQVFLVALDDRAIRRLTEAPGRHLAVQCSPNGRWLSYVRGGNLYCKPIDAGAGGSERQLTHDASSTVSNGLADFIAQEEMHRFQGHWWSPDESAIAFQRTDESPIKTTIRQEISAEKITLVDQRYPYAGETNADVRLGVFTLADETTRWLDYRYQHEDYLARVNWLASGLYLQVQERYQQRLRLGCFTPGSWHWRLVLEESSSSWINLHDNLKELPGDGVVPRLLWTTEAGGETSELQLLTLPNEPEALADRTTIAPPALYTEQVEIVTKDAAYVRGWLGDPTERHLYRVPLASGDNEPLQLTQEPGWHEPTVAADGSAFVSRHSTLHNPPTLSFHSIEAQDAQRLFGASLREQPYAQYLAQHCTPELGELTGPDGSRLCYRLTRPQHATADDPVPLIVHVYGGPGVSRVRNEWAPLSLQLFAQYGFGVFELDNRGSSGRGRRFEAPIHRAMGTAELEDQLAGVAFARGLPWVDGARIGLFGHSYGGYMTLRGLTRSDVFAAGVSVAPVTDWRLYDTHYTERYLKDPNGADSAYPASGILGELHKIRAPLLLMHGMADDNVLFSHCTAAMAELQQAGVLFELMTYPGSKHALQEPPVASHRFRTILAFFERHLGPVRAV